MNVWGGVGMNVWGGVGINVWDPRSINKKYIRSYCSHRNTI